MKSNLFEMLQRFQSNSVYVCVISSVALLLPCEVTINLSNIKISFEIKKGKKFDSFIFYVASKLSALTDNQN